MRAIVIDDRRSHFDERGLSGYEVVYLFKDDEPRPTPFDPAYHRMVCEKLRGMSLGDTDYVVVAPPVISLAICVAAMAQTCEDVNLLIWDGRRERYVPTTLGAYHEAA